MRLLSILCAAAIACASQSVLAADTVSMTDHDTAVRHDIQCMLLGMQVAGSPSPNVALEGKLMNNFFAGAVFSNSPQIDIQSAMNREAMFLATLNDKPNQIPAIGHQCATEMDQRLAQISAGLAALRQMVSQVPPKK